MERVSRPIVLVVKILLSYDLEHVGNNDCVDQTICIFYQSLFLPTQSITTGFLVIFNNVRRKCRSGAQNKPVVGLQPKLLPDGTTPASSSIHTQPRHRPNEGINKIKTTQNMGTSHTEKNSMEADQNRLK